MSYKLIIADDEQFMLQSLLKIINWEELGFEICASFSDGAQAVEYIKNHEVDVILTDIKMPKLDGLQLAEFVYNNYPAIKTILISGHQDFEFARQALKYNVSHYLLKPTRYSEIVQTFEEIRTQLDQKREDYDELLPLFTKQFFFDISTGALQKSDTIDKFLEAMGFSKEVKDYPCFLAMLSMKGYDHYMKNIWKHGVEGLSTAVWQFFSNDENDIKYYFFSQIDDKFHVIGISKRAMRADEIKNEADKYFKFKIFEIKELIEAEFTLKDLKLYSSLSELIQKGGYFAKSASEEHDMQKEYANLMIYYINSGDVEAVNNLLNNYYMSFGQQDINVIRDFNLKLLKKLSQNTDRDYTADFMQCDSLEAFRKTSRSVFGSITSYMQKDVSSEKQLIQNAKKYISEHCCDDISLETVAKNIYVSPVYICRVFKEQTGQNFIDYLTDMRMQKAMELLKDGRLKVYEVSDAVGYKSLKYFYKLFKQYTGTTPTEYRNKL